MKKLSLFAIAALLLTSCNNNQPKTTSEKALRINLLEQPRTLDPRKAQSLTDMNLTKMFMEGLTRVGKDGKAELALAERYTVSDDMKTYRFVLRKSKWSNGEPITAHDFVYSWKKTLSPQFPSHNAAQLYAIKNARGVKSGNLPASMLGIKAIDNQTLLVKLENATPYFLELTSSPPFFPVHTETDKLTPNWATKSETFVGSGPFLPEKWELNNTLTAKRNDNYWDVKSVKLNHINMVMVTSETALNMFENKELDWEGSPLSALSSTALPALKQTKVVHTEPSLGTFLIRINTENPALSNPKVRKALSYAVNRQAIVDHIVQGEQAIATRLVPQTLHLSDAGYFTDGNIQEARKLFEEAIEAGEITRADFYNVSLTHVNSGRSQKVCEAIQSQWREALDIEIKLQSAEPKVYYSRVNKQDYQLALGSWIADFNDAISFLEVFKKKNNGTNNTNWENDTYVAKLTQSDNCRDQTARQTLLKESETILMNDMPIIPLYHYNMLYIKQDNVKDVVLSNMGSIDLKWAYVD